MKDMLHTGIQKLLYPWLNYHFRQIEDQNSLWPEFLYQQYYEWLFCKHLYHFNNLCFLLSFWNKLWFVFLPLILVLEISKNLCSFPNCLLSKQIMPKDWILREIYVYVEFFVRWLVSIIGAYEKWISINI